jgi:hypothetical protein
MSGIQTHDQNVQAAKAHTLDCVGYYVQQQILNSNIRFLHTAAGSDQ